MKIQLLPNYFKWIGLLMFFVGGVPSFMKGWNEGYSEGAGDTSANFPYTFSEQTLLISALIGLLGMIIYALSREKIEDEFIKILRWQSVTIAFVISIIIVIIDMLLHGTKDIIDGQYLTELQLLIYLIVFYFKKRSNLGEIA